MQKQADVAKHRPVSFLSSIKPNITGICHTVCLECFIYKFQCELFAQSVFSQNDLASVLGFYLNQNLVTICNILFTVVLNTLHE